MNLFKGIILFTVGVALFSYTADARRVKKASIVSQESIPISSRVDNLSLPQLGALYSILPENSRGREADNPGRFAAYLNPESYARNNGDWPYAMLCINLETEELTWHIACNDWPLEQVTDNFTSASWVNMKNSSWRGKILKSIEIIWRRYDRDSKEYYYEHHFFPSKDEE